MLASSSFHDQSGSGLAVSDCFVDLPLCINKYELHGSIVTFHSIVPMGSPSRGGDVTVYVPHINQPSLPTPFYSVLVSVSVFMALSTVFLSINSPDNSLLSHSVLLVLFLPYWSFQQYVSLYKSLPQP